MKVPITKQQQNQINMTVQVDVQFADAAEGLPSAETISEWVRLAVGSVLDEPDATELTVRIVAENEMRELNKTYRNKDGLTNVLSFPFEADVPMETTLLGDIVVCAAVVNREAIEQHKPLPAHWAHLVIHGTLHLLGFDHLDDEQAAIMESREIQLLHQLGYANPYEVKHTHE